MDSAATLAAAETMTSSLLSDLETLVNIDSGTYIPAGVAQVADELRPRFEALGCAVEMVPGSSDLGPQMIARRSGQGRARVALIGHMDTVFPDGEAQRRPFELRDGRAYGPGVFDMKGGLLVGLYALRLLSEAGEAPYSELTFLCNSDEEIGSPTSRSLVAQIARSADAVLVLEPSADVERLTTARKGVGMYRLDVQGRSAHAGVEPRRGRNAILELAYRILSLHALNGEIEGVTVNVGVVSGGERPNVVAEHAHALIDVRATDQAGLTAIEDALRQVAAEAPHVPDTQVSLSGRFEHQPFPQNEQTMRLFALAEAEGQALGLTLQSAATGGASDGNTAAGLGIPTLDGLGPAGGLAHNPGEYVVVESFPLRIALLAGLLRRIDAANPVD